MATTANTFPTVGATVDRAGATAWTSPGNVVSDNATNASAVVPTDYLVTSGYGFSSTVPANVAIRGIVVRIEASETGTGSSSYIPQLHSNTTPTLIGTAKSAITITTGPTISTSGDIADTWGLNGSLTAAMVRDAGFGVSIWSTDTINTLSIDFVTIAITWTDVPNAWDATQYQRKRRRTTKRRQVQFRHHSALAVVEEFSADVALSEPFITVKQRSRRSLSVGWSAALTSQIQIPAEPVTAWKSPLALKRRSTELRLVSVPQHDVYPETPVAEVSDDRALEAPFVTRTIRSRKLQKLPQLNSFSAAQAPQGQPISAFTQNRARRRRPRKGLFLSSGAVVLSQPTGTISAAGSLSISGAADLDASGTLAATGALSISGAADLDARGSLAAAGTILITGAAELDAPGTLAAAGTLSITGAADLDSSGTLAAAGTLSITGAADLDGIGVLAAAGSLSISGAVDLDALGNLAAAGTLSINGNVELVDAGSENITATGTLSISGVAALNAPGTIAAAGTLSVTGAADLDASGTLAAAGSLSITGAADLDARGVLAAAGSLSISGTAHVTEADAVDLLASGSLSITGAAGLTAAGTVTAAGSLSVTGSADLEGSGVLVANGTLVVSGSADIRATGSLSSEGQIEIFGAALLIDGNAIPIVGAQGALSTGTMQAGLSQSPMRAALSTATKRATLS